MKETKVKVKNQKWENCKNPPAIPKMKRTTLCIVLDLVVINLIKREKKTQNRPKKLVRRRRRRLKHKFFFLRNDNENWEENNKKEVGFIRRKEKKMKVTTKETKAKEYLIFVSKIKKYTENKDLIRNCFGI